MSSLPNKLPPFLTYHPSDLSTHFPLQKPFSLTSFFTPSLPVWLPLLPIHHLTYLPPYPPTFSIYQSDYPLLYLPTFQSTFHAPYVPAFVVYTPLYLAPYLPSSLPTSFLHLPIWQPPSLSPHFSVYLSRSIRTCLPCIHISVPSSLAYLPTSLHTYSRHRPTSHQTHSSTSLPTYLPSYLSWCIFT